MLENVDRVEYLMGRIADSDPVGEVNEFLRLGWKLLNVHEARMSAPGPGRDESQAATMGFIVGWDDRHCRPIYPKGGYHDRCGKIPPDGRVAD